MLVFRVDDQRLLGASIVRERANELINVPATVLQRGGGLGHFVEAVYGHPTLAELLLRYHFAGTTALGTDTNGAKLRELWALPQSRALQLRTLDRLARAPQVLAGPALSPEQTEQGAALVRPLLADLIERESFLEARGTAGQDSEWLLGLALPPERAALWEPNLTRLMAAWQLGPVSSAPAANMTLPKCVAPMRQAGSVGRASAAGCCSAFSNHFSVLSRSRRSPE